VLRRSNFVADRAALISQVADLAFNLDVADRQRVKKKHVL
jgi:hypothetical protein